MYVQYVYAGFFDGSKYDGIPNINLVTLGSRATPRYPASSPRQPSRMCVCKHVRACANIYLHTHTFHLRLKGKLQANGFIFQNIDIIQSIIEHTYLIGLKTHFRTRTVYKYYICNNLLFLNQILFIFACALYRVNKTIYLRK